MSLIEFKDEESFIRQTITYIKSIIKDAVSSRGVAVIGLSGGSTPKPIYEALTATPDSDIDWSKVYFYIIDERYIDKTSTDSNYNLIANSIFAKSLSTHKLLEDGHHLVYPNTSLPLDKCIEQYGHALESLLRNSENRADLAILGMGDDGHIASIFPTDESAPAAPTDTVYHTTTTKFAVFDRITTNITVLSESRSKIFLLKGEKKLTVWNEMMNAPENIRRWPAKQIVKSGNTTIHFVK